MARAEEHLCWYTNGKCRGNTGTQGPWWFDGNPGEDRELGLNTGSRDGEKAQGADCGASGTCKGKEWVKDDSLDLER